MALKVAARPWAPRPASAPSSWPPRARCSRASPASGPSPTRRWWAATPSPTRPASTSTASWPTRSDYEIMTPASVGVRETLLVLGKHSGRHAVRVAAPGPRRGPDPRGARGRSRPRSRSWPTRRSSSTTTTCWPSRSTPRSGGRGWSAIRWSPATHPPHRHRRGGGRRRRAHGLGRGQRAPRRRSQGRRRRPRCGPGAPEMQTRAVSGGTTPWPRSWCGCATRASEYQGQAASTDSIEATLKAYLSAVAAAARPRPRRRRHDPVTAGRRSSTRSGTPTSCAPRPPTRRGALRRPPPGPRGHLAPGLLRAARARPEGPPARAHGGDHGPLHAHDCPGSRPVPVRRPEAAAQVGALEANCREFGITLYALGSERQGIVHVIGPELGSPSPA